MNQTAEAIEAGVSEPPDVLAAAERIVRESLAPQTVDIDLEGTYPEDVLRALGDAGAFRQHVAAGPDESNTDMGLAVEAMRRVSRECLSTGFAVWCQDTCAWYLHHAAESAVRDWLPRVASGEVLAGTGMSNTMKAFSGIESLRLKGRRVDGGYVVDGNLPWVSNLGPDHVFGTLFELEGGGSVMALIPCNTPGFQLRSAASFTALEGTRTFACIFEEVYVPDALVIDHDGPAFLKRARAGIVLLQFGMALGNIQACIELCRAADALTGHVNAYLDDRPAQMQEELDDLTEAAAVLMSNPDDNSEVLFHDILQARLAASELALRAAQSAMLHMGAKGYLRTAPAQRKLREAYFVAIVTPAIKHLRKELAAGQWSA